MCCPTSLVFHGYFFEVVDIYDGIYEGPQSLSYFLPQESPSHQESKVAVDDMWIISVMIQNTECKEKPKIPNLRRNRLWQIPSPAQELTIPAGCFPPFLTS